MESLLFFVIGALITYLILQKPLQITIHHKNETIISGKDYESLKELEEQMLKEDPKEDQLYEDFNKTLETINDIMGGSDKYE